jgi:hypothetical protein
VEARVRKLSWSVWLKTQKDDLMEIMELMPNKLKVLCEVDWLAFGVGWPLEVSLDKTVVNEVYRVIVKKKKNPNIQENGKSQDTKIGLQKPDSVVYLN